MSRSKAKVAIKYCGSCNPYLNVVRIAAHLAEVAFRRRDFEIVSPSENDIDVIVIICGCPRACGDRQDIRAKARQSLLIAGERLQGEAVAEERLPAAVEGELIKTIKRLRGESKGGSQIT